MLPIGSIVYLREGMISPTSAIMDSIRDIMDLPKLDDEEFLHNVNAGKKKTKETVEELHGLDVADKGIGIG